MEIKQLAETVYAVIKHDSLWKKKDLEKIGYIEDILQKFIDSELQKIGFVPVINKVDSVKVELIKVEPLPQTEPQNFMSRIFAEQDEIIDKVIIKEEKKEKIIKEKNKGIVKRYWVEWIAKGVRVKPNYQFFKGNDIIEKDFKTDVITKQEYFYYAIIDTTDIDNIKTDLFDKFLDMHSPRFTEQELTFIPTQYSTIFRNQTTI